MVMMNRPPRVASKHRNVLHSSPSSSSFSLFSPMTLHSMASGALSCVIAKRALQVSEAEGPGVKEGGGEGGEGGREQEEGLRRMVWCGMIAMLLPMKGMER